MCMWSLCMYACACGHYVCMRVHVLYLATTITSLLFCRCWWHSCPGETSLARVERVKETLKSQKKSKNLKRLNFLFLSIQYWASVDYNASVLLQCISIIAMHWY